MVEAGTRSPLLGEMPAEGNIRYWSLAFSRYCRDPLKTGGIEKEIAQVAREHLIRLRPVVGESEDIYRTYAGGDILEGLAAVDHPVTQLVIAEMGLTDPQDLVASKAEHLLRDPKRKIYPQTLDFLLDQGEREQELAVSILENTEFADQIPGISFLLAVVMAKHHGSLRTALLVSNLAQKTTIAPLARQEAVCCLGNILNQKTEELKKEENFVGLVKELIAENINVARRNADIGQMPLTLSAQARSVQEIIDALTKLRSGLSLEYPLQYPSSLFSPELHQQALMALARFKARQELSVIIAKERQEAESRRQARETELKWLGDERAIQARIQREQESEQRRKALLREHDLIQYGGLAFPHLYNLLLPE